MATIALYAAQVNQMSGLLSEVKRTVTDYKSELAALKKKTLTINQSICNLESVLSSIQTSTKLQEQKSESLDTVKQNSEEFIVETDRIDGAVAEVIQQRTDNFYQQYSYLKPECQKNWAEKAKNWFTEVGAWCNEHWKAVATVVIVIAAVLLICTGVGGILGAIALGALLGAAIGGVTGGLISVMMGGSFWEGFVNGAFIGAIGGMISEGMGFALAGKAALTLGQTVAIGAASGSGVSFVNDMETILIGGQELSLGEVIRNMIIGGTFGAAFAGIGYGMSKAFAALKVKFSGIKGGTDRYINGQRTSKYHELTDTEIASLKNDIRDIGADESLFRFNKGYQTGYSDKKGLIYVKGDVLPDVTSTHPRDLMSSKAVLAHEYYGHKNFGDLYGSRNPIAGAWNDEFRASYNAALNSPNLSQMDRMYLMSDALERAKEAGVNIRITDTIRRILYGY